MSRENREDRENKVVVPLNATGVYGNARFVHAIAALVGHVVEVRLHGDKDIYEGVLFTISPTFDIALNTVHVMDREAPEANAEAPQAPGHLAGLLRNMDRIRKNPNQPLQETMIFHISNIVSLTASNIDLDFAIKENAFTDSQISRSNGRVQERDLQVWMDDDTGGEGIEDGHLEDISGASTSWTAEEMFKTNQKLFGVESTYQDNLKGYTYQIPERNDAEFREKEAMAAKIASEIESNPQHKRNYELENGGDEDDEETRYSAVVMADDRNRTQQQQQSQQQLHSQQQPQQQQQQQPQQQQQQQERSESRFAHNHRRKQMPSQMNGGVKGTQRGAAGGHHSQRNNHNRSPPMGSPSPQQSSSHSQLSHQQQQQQQQQQPPPPQQQQQQQQQREQASRKDQQAPLQAPSQPPQQSPQQPPPPQQQQQQVSAPQAAPIPVQQQQQPPQQQQQQQVAPNTQPQPQQQDNKKASEKHAPTRKTPSPKLDAAVSAAVPKKETPAQGLVHELKKSPPGSPPGEPKASKASPTPERSASPRTAKTPSPSPSSASSPQANTEEIVKKSTLNPNAKDFVPTPKPQTMSHKHGVPQGHLNNPVAGHGGPRGGHISLGGPAQGAPHAQGGGVIMTPFSFPGPAGPHQHQHQHQPGGHNRSYRGGKGQNRQAIDQTMHVTGPPMVQGPQQQQVLVSYPPPNPYAPGHPAGVASNVMTMQPQLGHVPTQQVQMVNYSLVPTRGVMSPPGAPAGVFPPMQLYSDASIHLAPQPQMILREFTNPIYPGQLDANVFVAVSPSAQTPSQSGAPTPPTATSGPHGHPTQPPMNYSSQPPWPGQPLLMMSANGGTPPPHHAMNLIMGPAPPPLAPSHAAGHGPAHGHGHFAQAIAVQNGPGTLQVQTGPVVTTGPPTNSNVTPGQAPQAPSQATPTGQAPTSGVVVPPPNQSGQQTGPQQPPQQTQQTPGRANRT